MQLAKKYLKKRQKAIGFLFQKNKSDYTISTFHDLRLELKKLNAFFDFLNFCTKEFKLKKNTKLFKLIFHQAGKVRELQLEQLMLKKYFGAGRMANYKTIIKDAYLKEAEVFFEITGNKDFISDIKRSFRKVRPFVKKVTQKKVINYLDVERKEIRELLGHKPLKIVQLHLVRKHLKRFDYIRKRLCTDERKATPAKNALSDLLGKWHDQQVMISNLQKAVSGGHVNSKEINLLKKAEAKISAERNLLLKKIRKAIPLSEFLIPAVKRS